MAYPSTLSTLANPSPTDKLSSPSHSGLHDDENTAIIELQTFVGTLSSTAGTLINDIRSSSSDGGGHVQTAVKGGTGQTSYVKGNLLVAQNSSTLSKLSIGTDNQVLVADSSQLLGVKWGIGASTKIGNSAASVVVSSVTGQVSVMSATVPASALGTSGAIRATLFVQNFTTNDNQNETWTVRPMYGTSSLATIVIGSVFATTSSMAGKIEYNLVANGAANAQRATVFTNLYRTPLTNSTGSIQGLVLFNMGSASEDSGAVKTISMTVESNIANPANQIVTSGYIIESIT